MTEVSRAHQEGGVGALPPIESVVADGLLIALAGVKLSVKNFLIVTALRDRRDYDEQRVHEFAKSELLRVATEMAEKAGSMEWSSQPVLSRTNALTRMHRAAVDRGPDVYRALTEALRSHASEADPMARLIQQSREAASEELQDAIVRRLSGQVVEPDTNYASDRSKRMRRVRADVKALRWVRARKAE
ncbi:hypothetical protein ABS642_21475 [Microbacterium sp. A8/3-1]|uniref:Asparagine synthase n=1 Tax=Microbacterium sp. A8/3-1 TaxID=3160749 RepID=A0AAU7VWG4_9MICO